MDIFQRDNSEKEFFLIGKEISGFTLKKSDRSSHLTFLFFFLKSKRTQTVLLVVQMYMIKPKRCRYQDLRELTHFSMNKEKVPYFVLLMEGPSCVSKEEANYEIQVHVCKFIVFPLHMITYARILNRSRS